jgi:lipid A disaccharide synthetase
MTKHKQSILLSKKQICTKVNIGMVALNTVLQDELFPEPTHKGARPKWLDKHVTEYFKDFETPLRKLNRLEKEMDDLRDVVRKLIDMQYTSKGGE